MYARMTIVQVKLENIEDGIRIFRTSIIPEAKKQKGYRGACLLIDRAAGQGRAVTFWRSEKDILASEENRFYQEQLVKILGYLSGPLIRESYEVIVHSTNEPKPKKPKKPKTPKRKSRKS
jgi:heme-degrading monooxygenase HmoA